MLRVIVQVLVPGHVLVSMLTPTLVIQPLRRKVVTPDKVGPSLARPLGFFISFPLYFFSTLSSFVSFSRFILYVSMRKC